MSPAEQVEAFNRRCHVGDLVERVDDVGKVHRTRVVWPAFLFADSAVVGCEDAGAYLLERVTPVRCLYDCRDDNEHLVYDDPVEAITSHLDDCYEPGSKESLAETIARVAPLVVYEFAHEVVSDRWVEKQAERLFELFEESFEEDFADWECEHSPWPPAERDAIKGAVRAVLGAAAARGDVWRCEVVREIAYSEDELRALFTEAELAERGV